jgi:uncharacterized protein
MKIAIISDIHDNLPNLEKVLKYCQENKIEKIICCGDLASEETFDRIAEFKGEIFLVLGNMDEGHVEYIKIKDKYPNCRIFDFWGEIKLDNTNIGFTHKPEDAINNILKSKIKFDFVFHGHTHKPWIEDYQGVKLANPGNVANQFFAPTFAVLDTASKVLKLVTLNNIK